MKFELEEIRAVFFRCNQCRTAVSFPRIRWVKLPERCPNCGAAWMREPAAELTFSEEIAIRAFQAANAFRDALQTLIAVARTAGFTIGLETDDRTESLPGNSPQRSGKPQRHLNRGKVKAAG